MNLTSIIIVGIICWMVVTIVKTVQTNGKAKLNSQQNKNFDDYTKVIDQRLEEMSERIATLEKIVTDEKYNLKKEFDKL